MSINACNEHLTTMSTVEMWSALNDARLYCVHKALTLKTPEDVGRWTNSAVEYLRQQQHIERIVNSGENITTCWQEGYNPPE